MLPAASLRWPSHAAASSALRPGHGPPQGKAALLQARCRLAGDGLLRSGLPGLRQRESSALWSVTGTAQLPLTPAAAPADGAAPGAAQVRGGRLGGAPRAAADGVGEHPPARSRAGGRGRKRRRKGAAGRGGDSLGGERGSGRGVRGSPAHPPDATRRARGGGGGAAASRALGTSRAGSAAAGADAGHRTARNCAAAPGHGCSLWHVAGNFSPAVLFAERYVGPGALRGGGGWGGRRAPAGWRRGRAGSRLGRLGLSWLRGSRCSPMGRTDLCAVGLSVRGPRSSPGLSGQRLRGSRPRDSRALGALPGSSEQTGALGAAAPGKQAAALGAPPRDEPSLGLSERSPRGGIRCGDRGVGSGRWHRSPEPAWSHWCPGGCAERNAAPTCAASCRRTGAGDRSSPRHLESCALHPHFPGPLRAVA